MNKPKEWLFKQLATELKKATGCSNLQAKIVLAQNDWSMDKALAEIARMKKTIIQ